MPQHTPLVQSSVPSQPSSIEQPVVAGGAHEKLSSPPVSIPQHLLVVVSQEPPATAQRTRSGVTGVVNPPPSEMAASGGAMPSIGASPVGPSPGSTSPGSTSPGIPSPPWASLPGPSLRGASACAGPSGGGATESSPQPAAIRSKLASTIGSRLSNGLLQPFEGVGARARAHVDPRTVALRRRRDPGRVGARALSHHIHPLLDGVALALRGRLLELILEVVEFLLERRRLALLLRQRELQLVRFFFLLLELQLRLLLLFLMLRVHVIAEPAHDQGQRPHHPDDRLDRRVFGLDLHLQVHLLLAQSGVSLDLGAPLCLLDAGVVLLVHALALEPLAHRTLFALAPPRLLLLARPPLRVRPCALLCRHARPLGLLLLLDTVFFDAAKLAQRKENRVLLLLGATVFGHFSSLPRPEAASGRCLRFYHNGDRGSTGATPGRDGVPMDLAQEIEQRVAAAGVALALASLGQLVVAFVAFGVVGFRNVGAGRGGAHGRTRRLGPRGRERRRSGAGRRRSAWGSRPGRGSSSRMHAGLRHRLRFALPYQDQQE